MAAQRTGEFNWRKSSYSGTGTGNCVEIVVTASATWVRDSKAPGAGELTCRPSAWQAFLADVRR